MTNPTEQPLALRLADKIDTLRQAIDWSPVSAELRRLTAEVERMSKPGHVWVPVEPTDAMKKAGGHANSEWLNDNAPIGESRYAMPMDSVWLAMLQAAHKDQPQDFTGDIGHTS